MKPGVKKLIIANLPYLLFVYLFGKLGQAYRLAEGIDLSQKLLHFAYGCAAAFANAAPSFNPFDLLIGVAGAATLWNACRAHGTPLIMVAAKPHLGDGGVPPVISNFRRIDMAVIVDDRHLFRVFVIQRFCCPAGQQKVLVQKRLHA